MSKPFLSQSWYRVAGLRPKLRADVRVSRHRYHGSGWYVLEDPLTGKSHRLTASAYAFVQGLDGELTVDELWQAVAARLDEDAPTQDEVIELLSQLHGNELLQAGTVPDIAELADRQRKYTRALHRQNLLNPVSLRVPLADPDRLLAAIEPLVRPLIGVGGFVLWLALLVPAAILAAQHWSALTENLSDSVLSRDNLIVLFLVYPVVKLAHELGHGLVAKCYGAAVHEVGLMFLVFVPVPYVDASGASAFESKWQRAFVGAAGIIVETSLAALALYAWLLLEPGLARAICFNVMLIGGVSTVLVNANPLIRFDGYYILIDLIEMPNLAARANKFFGRMVETKLFGGEVPDPAPITLRERIVFSLYAPLSYVYRLWLTLSIAAFVAQSYFAAGVAAALYMIWQSFVYPLFKALRHVLRAPSLRRVRMRAVGMIAGAVATVAALAMLVPLPAWSTVEGIAWLPDTAQVRAGTGGEFVRLAVSVGAPVAAGQHLADLRDPEIDMRIAALDAKVRGLVLKLVANTVSDKVLAETTRIELEQARKELEREQFRRGRMTVTSPGAGRFEPARPTTDLAGRYFKEGELVGYVLPRTVDLVRVAVQQDIVDQVRHRLVAVELVPLDAARHPVASRLVREVPAGQLELPGAQLSTAAGGAIATDPRDGKHLTALSRVFQFDAVVDPPWSTETFAARVHVKLTFTPEPAGYQIWRRARQLFLGKFNV